MTAAGAGPAERPGTGTESFGYDLFMPSVAAQAPGAMSRRERFRSYMARMAAAADPTLAIEQHMYVRPARPLAEDLVGRLEIEPQVDIWSSGELAPGRPRSCCWQRRR